jgi:hypothetical protein
MAGILGVSGDQGFDADMIRKIDTELNSRRFPPERV